MNKRKQNTMKISTRRFMLVLALLSAITLSLPGLAEATTYSTSHD
jgi:hypothetical protein